MSKKAGIFFLFLQTGTFIFAQNTLILNETFSNNKNEWYTDEWIYLKNGAYIINAEKNNAASWRNTPIRDCKIQIQTRWKDGLDNFGYGLIFRMKSNDQFYVFWIAAQGYFLAGKIDGSNSSLFNKWTLSNKIHKKGLNTLQVEVKGAHITGWVNGFELFSADDTSYTEGGFGFYCQKGVVAEFDNLKVWEYPVAASLQQRNSETGLSLVRAFSRMAGALKECTCLKPQKFWKNSAEEAA
ncbi:MAG: hypothetical protein JW904_10615 [Spirochaetales bacterium]|nr:hypothetical protein [Spirochaetales bacterium]